MPACKYHSLPAFMSSKAPESVDKHPGFQQVGLAPSHAVHGAARWFAAGRTMHAIRDDSTRKAAQ